MQAVRDRLIAVIEAVCGGAPKAHEVADGFGVHRKLGWQIWNIAYLDDPLAAIRHRPSERGLKAWRDAAQRRGAPAELLDALTNSINALDRLAHKHADSRELLEIMLDSAEPAALDAKAELRWRKMAFTGNTYVWGVRARTFLATSFQVPSQRPGFFDMVTLRGLFDLIRTRPNVRWPFAQSVVYSSDDERHPAREPLAVTEATRDLGTPLLEAFCSKPLPPAQRRRGESGMLEDELAPGAVGQTGGSTIVTGEIIREVAPVYATTPGEDAMFGVGVRTPSETLICDYLVHRDLFGPVRRELRVYSELASPTPRDDRDRLPVSERVLELGRGISRIRTAEAPRYHEMVDFVLGRMGWDAEAFYVYRVRMRYAPIPISVMVHHALPEAPEGVFPAGVTVMGDCPRRACANGPGEMGKRRREAPKPRGGME